MKSQKKFPKESLGESLKDHYDKFVKETLEEQIKESLEKFLNESLKGCRNDAQINNEGILG